MKEKLEGALRRGSLGARLRKIRRARGLTRAELAAKANLPEERVARIETRAGATAARMTLFRLANALEVRPEWLRSGAEPSTPSTVEKRLVRIYAQMDIVRDAQLAEAIKQARHRYHRGIVIVASTFAEWGERHTVEGWMARLDEIAETFAPLLDDMGIRAVRARKGSRAQHHAKRSTRSLRPARQ